MYRYLPSLNALRAFEAASRHGNFTRAAEELCVTQGAVSRQVKNLEEYFDAKLFSRGANSLNLTDAGRSLAPSITEALSNLDRAAGALLRDRNVLRLQVMPTFAVRWLMPRLPEFSKAHPRIDVRVTIALHPARLDTDSFDAGILYGDGSWQDTESYCLSRECLAPVCAADWADSHPAFNKPEDFGQTTLLHTTTDRRDWPWWLKAVGADGLSGDKGPAFETLDMAVRAAEAGHGIALGDLSLIAEDLNQGKLRLAMPPPLYTGRGVYFVLPSQGRHNDALITLCDWLLETAPVKTCPERSFI
ncbi:LysR substrate-binding domain-containing protein [Pelagibius sp. Alg239-R121]|uniref:LysR substrate-binding domain-containing protein n=1 Tax=Pelagibius sp. Alg239-R121 TaxID=2993448 RepID=UPI0024A67BB9|nr:LysR substrate-binding domain-containing protein [Pelagibius sp. Alg239-R121]